ncbi:hypothetical protein Tco_1428666 [Tanacetum coccineum]
MSSSSKYDRCPTCGESVHPIEYENHVTVHVEEDNWKIAAEARLLDLGEGSSTGFDDDVWDLEFKEAAC